MYGKSILEKLLPLWVWYNKLGYLLDKKRKEYTQSTVCDVCGNTGFVDEVKIVNGKGIIVRCPRGCLPEKKVKNDQEEN
jgi:hypothetical protein